MIRTARDSDLEILMTIWLQVNIKAHDFIDPQYWISNEAQVRPILLDYTVIVATDKNDTPIGFIGLDDSYILGLFIASEFQSLGLGKALLSYAQSNRDSLQLNVYQKNTRALNFYTNNGFKISQTALDEATNEYEHSMTWAK